MAVNAAAHKTLEKWEVPDANTIKLNVDAGCFDDGLTYWGMLTRDKQGSVFFAATRREKVCVFSSAGRSSWFEMVPSLGKRPFFFENLIIESDAYLVVRCLHALSR